ncbi:MAG: helix-turn-helix domain-containing protein [Candidatus Fimenecus sp.]
MNFGDNLKKICSDRDTTPTALLKKLGISTSKVSAWYNGALPKIEMLELLADALDCSVKDFFASEQDIRCKILTPDENDILRVYRGLSRRMKHEFMSRVYTYEPAMENEDNE